MTLDGNMLLLATAMASMELIGSGQSLPKCGGYIPLAEQ